VSCKNCQHRRLSGESLIERLKRARHRLCLAQALAHPFSLAEVLGAAAPVEVYGDDEIRVGGWYAELDADCEGSDGGPDPDVAWLQRDCPLRVLLPDQPTASITQAEMEATGLRLAAPLGRPFPARSRPEGVELRLQQLVFIGHFDDPAAARCDPELRDRCRNTFVVSTHRGLMR
jgi:hypothetical protein